MIEIKNHYLIQNPQSSVRLKSALSCKNGNQANCICINEHCRLTEKVVCHDINCECFQQSLHQNCPVFQIKIVSQKINRKIREMTQALELIYNFLDQIKFQFSIQSQQKYTLQKALSYSEVQFFQKIKNNENISTWLDLVKLIQLEQQNNYFKIRQLGKLKRITIYLLWISNHQKIEPFLNSITRLINLQLLPLEIPINSPINSPKLQEKVLIKPLPERINNSAIITDWTKINQFFSVLDIKFQLIYRASQQRFSVQTFHQKCDQFPGTLTIIRTQFDKIIGGYTPIPWSSNCQILEDNLQQTFIFSLTNSKKYKINPNNYAVCHSPIFGPHFGLESICIWDNANIEYSTFLFPYYYNDTTKNNNNLLEDFSGSKIGQVRLKEWQVFRVIKNQ